MATDFDKAIITGGAFKPSTIDTPVDVRSRIATIADVETIPNPFVSLIFYVMDEDKFYYVQSLKDKVIAGITIKNALVGTYKEFGGSSSDLSYEVVEDGLEDVTL